MSRLPVALREQAFWRLLHDTGASAPRVLGLDADQIDLDRCRMRRAGDDALAWSEPAGQLLCWLLAGRTWGPVFVTGRRMGARSSRADADVCRPTGQARLSYRRAAEIFAAATRRLDPTGRGWTLHQLSTAGGH